VFPPVVRARGARGNGAAGRGTRCLVSNAAAGGCGVTRSVACAEYVKYTSALSSLVPCIRSASLFDTSHLDGACRVRHGWGVNDVIACAVCGESAASDRTGGLLFVGKRWFFCGPPCRITFKRDPERWAAERPEGGVSVASASALPRTRVISPFKVR